MKLGLDDSVGFEPPKILSPDVTVRVRKEIVPGERCPLLNKEYETPKGTLWQAVCQTKDWPHGDDIPMFTDHVVPRSRSRKYLIETIDGADALSCVYSNPSRRQLDEFADNVSEVRRFAGENDVFVECGAMDDAMGFFMGDTLAWLCGIENTVRFAYAQPDLVNRLLDLILEWDLRHLEQISTVGGCDVIVHRGWYECYWSPRLYEAYLVPKLLEGSLESNR